MRFPSIQTFPLDELLLDETNPRFGAAADQSHCIAQLATGDGFRRLMTSVAEDDLGEPLLVLQTAEGNIVMDGNRRTAALKVLQHPEVNAPTTAVKKQAQQLMATSSVTFDAIQAQTSDDPALISRTIYERHSAGGGISRINWSALAAARFGYQHNAAGAKDWRAMVLLHEVESTDDTRLAFINSDLYFHDIFRRGVRSAIKLGLINERLFRDGEQRFSQRPPSGSKAKAMLVSKQILDWIADGTLTLKRGSQFASAERCESLLTAKFLPAGPQPAPPPEPPPTDASAPNSPSPKPPAGPSPAPAPEPSTPSTLGSTSPSPNPTPPNRLPRSTAIADALASTRLTKLVALYSQLCNLSLNTNGILLWLGAWTLFETLGRNLAPRNEDSFGTLNQAVKTYCQTDRNRRKTLQQCLRDLQSRGDCIKHDGDYFLTNAQDLPGLFAKLEPFMLHVLAQLSASTQAANHSPGD